MKTISKSTQNTPYKPQVKICGLTNVEQALGCAALGADAIGCVFYPKSPRHLTEQQAKGICTAMPKGVKTVGVFVNETLSYIMRKVERCRLTAVQLHGQESPELVKRLLNENLMVIKALFLETAPALKAAQNYEASAFLVECGRGTRPGGNALTWDWKQAKQMAPIYPLILAGGLSPENVSLAVAACSPAAVDVSSGVEKSPGQKDLEKVKAFITAISRGRTDKSSKRQDLFV